MSRLELVGVDGSNPLGFLSALGVLRVVPGAKLGFSDDGSFRAFLDGVDVDLAKIVAADAKSAEAASAPWRLSYTKAATKKQGPKQVDDLKAPPSAFKLFLQTSLEAWLKGADEAASYAAAYGTDVAVDGKGNTKPTAFHFTAAQQEFLGSVEGIRASVTEAWVRISLFHGHGEKPGGNLRWDPRAERSWALMAGDPQADGTSVDAPLEWLAFRGLPLLPSFPRGARISTTGVSGRGEEMTFKWPLWSVPASLRTVQSVLQIDWTETSKNRRRSPGAGPVVSAARERAARGVFAVCGSAIRRTSQGFGNFGPSSVT